MPSIYKTRHSYRRAIFVYLVAIVGPTLVFLYLGLQSVQRQRQAITSLTASNLRLSAEKLAGELERRVQQLAEAALGDDGLAGHRLTSGGPAIPEEAVELRTLLAGVGEQHPIARHYFILEGSLVRFPLLRTPPYRRLDAYLAREAQDTGQRFEALFAEGETRKLRQQRPDRALSTYRKSYELPVSDELKALALARVARCLQKLNRAKAAEKTYRTLREQYGDVYDGFHRPYGVVAAFELDDLAKAQGASAAQPLMDLYRDLVRGRWELSADQMEHFLASVENRLEALPEVDKTSYLNHLELARAVQANFRHFGSLHAGEVYAYEFPQDDTQYQIFYTPYAVDRGTEILVGFAVDLNWIESQLLPQCRNALGLDTGFAVALKPGQGAPGSANDLEAQVAFDAVFPFWQLSIAPASAEAWKATARRDLLVFAGSTFLILGVLVLGVLLLMRDVSREFATGRQRADFISAVSHELKTPLTLIRLYAETLLHGKRFPEQERRNFYQIMTRESERLSHLVEKVLDFSSIDRGQKQYDLQEGDLASAVARTVGVYEQYLSRQGYEVETRLVPHLPPVKFDPDAVSEAILNLMDNAAKYSGESKFVGVRLYAQEEGAIFEVEDRGIGIPPGEREKIYQQFYRSGDHTGKGGYGLGLFLVKHIMDAHNGKIELKSEPGRGTRFRLVFPMCPG